MDRSGYGEGDVSSEPYGLTYQPYRLTKKDTPAPGCELPFLFKIIPAGQGFLAHCQNDVINACYRVGSRTKDGL